MLSDTANDHAVAQYIIQTNVNTAITQHTQHAHSHVGLQQINGFASPSPIPFGHTPTQLSGQ